MTEAEVLAAVPKELFIAGAWRPADSGARLEVEDPATGRALCQIADAGEADAQAALDAAADAQAEWNDLDPTRPLVVEGSGALSKTNRELATLGIWLELDEPTRKARALARDGAMYEPHWDAWAAQEQRFFDRERPDLLADLVLTGD